MNIDEIRKQAPQGAVFYALVHGGIKYIKCAKGFWLIWSVCEWQPINSLDVQSLRNSLRRLES